MTQILAYLDPGTGSILLQAVVAAALGAGFAFRTFIGSIFSRFRRGKGEEEKSDVAED